MRAANFPDGIDGSMVRRRMPRAVEEKSAVIDNLRFLLEDCSNADLLSGSVTGLPFPFRAGGSWLGGLESPLAAFFASSSTASLPGMLA